MAEFAIHEDLYKSEAHRLAFKYLRREYDAVISRGTKSGEFWLFLINGDGIPGAKHPLGISVYYIVPNVAMITIDY